MNISSLQPIKLPITEYQKGIWLTWSFNRESPAYNLSRLYKLEGEINLELLEQSFKCLIEYHLILRGVFAENEDQIQLVIDTDNEIVINYISVELGQGQSLDEEIQSMVKKDAQKGFDLLKGPVYRITIFEAPQNQVYIYINIHHIVFDGYSWGIFIKDFNKIYKNISEGHEPYHEMKDLFEDYLNLQKVQKNSQHEDELKEFWQKYLAEIPVSTDFPFDKIRSKIPTGKGRSEELIVPSDLTRKIREIAKDEHLTVFQIVLALFSLLIQKYSKEEDFCIGIPVSDRLLKPPVLGMYVETLPVRLQVDNKQTVSDFLHAVKENLSDLLKHRGLSFERIVNTVKPKRTPYHSPIFQINFAWTGRETGISGFHSETFDSKKLIVREGASPFDMLLVLRESKDSIHGTIDYNTDLLKESTIKRLKDNFIQLIRNSLENINSELSGINFLTTGDRQKLVEWNSTTTPYENQLCIHKKLEKQTLNNPDSTAVIWQTQKYSYRQFNSMCNRLANYLKDTGIEIEDKIVLSMERSLEMLVSIYAILKAGATYVPVDPKFPAQRIQAILDDAQPRLIISKTAYQSCFKETNKLLCLDDIEKFTVGQHILNPDVDVKSKHLAYIIYTSGSTGKPKGVCIEHHSVLNRIGWMQKEYSINKSDILVQKTPITFDVSVWELFWWTFTGSSLVLLEPGQEKECDSLIDVINTHKISTIHFVPAMFGAFINQLEAFECQNKIVSLKKIFLSGEALPTRMVDQFYSLLDEDSEIQLVNLYGPTEATVDVSHFLCKPKLEVETVYIGQAIDNTKLWVINSQNEILPIGIPGELVITGVNLAREYLNMKELNQEKFIELTDLEGKNVRAYKTGDLAQYTDDGNIYYIGRLDNQVKLRGYRIELGDIESALLEMPEVKSGAVLVNRSNPENPLLVGYLTHKSNSSISEQAIKEFLLKRLPEYMVPQRYVILSKMPLSTNGKINRKALPDIESYDPGNEELISGETEKKLLSVWREVLKSDKIGLNTNFFDAGGSSILVPSVINKLKKLYNLEFKTLDFFIYPTIRQLADSQQVKMSIEESEYVKIRNTPTRSDESNDIAIIGMAARLPGANNLKEFWDNLCKGKESLSLFTDKDIQNHEYDFEDLLRRDDYLKTRGILDDIDMWDANFFGLTANEAKQMDPQHRIWLELVWHALEDAACDPFTYKGNIGVYAGASLNTYLLNNVLNNRSVYNSYTRLRSYDSYQIYLENDPTFLPTRTSYLFNLRGPAMNIQTACSTSLVAVIQACKSLLCGESDICLAGGVNVKVPQKIGYIYYDGGIRSKDGHCRPFDKEGTGIVGSNGAGVVVLKRLKDAIEDRNQIYSIIKGWAINNDGNIKAGFTAPSSLGQSIVIENAQKMAGVLPEEIDYIEAHGTATPIGDPIEVEALNRVFRKHTNKKQFCGVGSVKSNFGHTDIAAGVTSLIKASLACKNRLIPPSINYSEANPGLELEKSPFYVVDKSVEFNKDSSLKIGVSSFGLGGTNAHVVIQSNGFTKEVVRPEENEKLFLLPFSAKSDNSLQTIQGQYVDFLNSTDCRLQDIAHTLYYGRNHMPKRAIVVGNRNIGFTIEDFFKGETEKESYKLVFAFPGGGAQFIGMGKNLYDSEPVFRQELDKCFSLYKAIFDSDLKSVMFWEKRGKLNGDLINEIDIIQPALFCIEYSMAKLLMSYDIKPDYFIGHSTGDYVAACLSGIFDLETGLRIVVKRGMFMKSMPAGKMMAVRAGEKELKRLNKGIYDISAVNAPQASTISFKPENTQSIIELLEEEKIDYLEFSLNKAFHSADCEFFMNDYAEFVDNFSLLKPEFPMISSFTGEFITDEEAVSGEFWAKQTRGTVKFNNGVNKLIEQDKCVFLEVGPSTHLSSMLFQNENIKDKSSIIHTIGREGEDEKNNFYIALGKLWIKGIDLPWTKLNVKDSKFISLPSYPFDKKRYWIDLEESDSEFFSKQKVELSSKNSKMFELVQYSQDVSFVQRNLIDLWKEFLGDENIEITSDFFELGGHSLLALQIINRINDQFKTEIKLKEYLKNPTIKKLSTLIEERLKVEIEHETGKEDGRLSTITTDTLALTNDQIRLWMITKITKNSPIYNIPYTKRFTGNIDAIILHKSIELVLNRHVVFKTRIRLDDNNPICNLQNEFECKVELQNWSDTDYSENQLQKFLTEATRKQFRLEDEPLFRAFLIILDSSTIIFHLAIHHLIIDGWSFGIFMREVEICYEALVSRDKIELPTISFDYYDYAREINSQQKASEYSESIKYWRKQLQNPPSLINLPWSKDRPSISSGTGGRLKYSIPYDIGERLIALSKKEKVSLFSLFYTSLSLLLKKLSGDDDICIGAAVSNRNNSKYEDIIGLFVNTVVLRKKYSRDETFISSIHQSSSIILEALSHQDVPFEKVIEQLEIDREQNINPIFQVILSWVATPKTNFSSKNIRLDSVNVKEGCSPLDLTVYAYEMNGTICGEIEYNNDVLDREFAIRFLSALVELLDQVTRSSDKKLSEYTIVTPDELQHLESFSTSKSSYPSEISIDRLFRDVASTHKKQMALIYKDTRITYAELDAKTDQLAAKLIEDGIQSEDVIGLYTPKSTEFIIGMLAILKAGAAYLPLDPDFPHERINYMIEDTSCKLVLTLSTLTTNLPTDTRHLVLDMPDSYIIQCNVHQVSTSSVSLAYIMYTSGTTGKPKGSLIEHKSVVRLVRNTNYIDLNVSDKVLLTGAVGFDATTFEIWGALLNGGTLYVVDKEVILDPVLLDRELKKNRITTLWLTSSLFTQLAGTNPELFSDLRYLLAGGDVLSVELINKVRKLFPTLTIINGYGPTENTTFSTCHIIEREYTGNIPIGKPISNSTAYVFDGDMNYCPVGVPGELYVGGDGVSRGYLNDEELTRKKFVKHPFNPEERLFKTGDKVKWLPDGNIAFYGRMDNQLKINGFRVELGEIESILTQLPEIQVAIVIHKKSGNNHPELHAYIQPSLNQKITRENVDQHMYAYLPSYMIPTEYRIIDNLPLTPNGKVDRKSLQSATLKMLTRSSMNINTRNDEMLEQVKEIWNTIFGRKVEDPDAEFFAIGGHSLLAMRMINRLETEYKLTVSYRTFLIECNTMGKMAEFLRSRVNIIEQAKKNQNKETFKHMFCIQPEGDGHTLFNIFAEEVLLFDDELFGRKNPVYAFLWPEVRRARFEINTVEELAEDYIKQMKKVNPTGPYFLLGYSFGGLLVHEIACRLQREGFEVPLLCIIDSQHPAVVRDSIVRPKKKLLEFGLGIRPRITDLNVLTKAFLGIQLDYSQRKKLLFFWVKRVYRKYKPNFYDGKLILFRSDINSTTDKYLGWQKTVNEIEVSQLPGGHQDATKVRENKVLVSKELRKYLLKD